MSETYMAPLNQPLIRNDADFFITEKYFKIIRSELKSQYMQYARESERK